MVRMECAAWQYRAQSGYVPLPTGEQILSALDLGRRLTLCVMGRDPEE
ncbi:MAG: hypothetical protein RID81_07010 [Sandaracinaceae bacterium]